MNTKRNLCDTCTFEIPTCEYTSIIFGDSFGNDNVIGCSGYKRDINMAIVLDDFKAYRKVGRQLLRPYIDGENMDSISVGVKDTPEVGGMIAINIKDTRDQWYVSKQFFNDNYELA